MILIIQNQTSNVFSYLGGIITVPPNGSVTVPSQYLYPASRDPGLNRDCLQSNVAVNDSVTTYTLDSAVAYLNQIATSIGGAVVALAGSPVPLYAIMVGGKDPNGNAVFGEMDISGNLIVRGAPGSLTDRSGTATGTSTQIMAANSNRKYMFVQNLGNQAIYLNFTSAATAGSGSISLSPLQSFVMEGSYISTEAVMIIKGNGPDQPFTAKEG